MLLKRYIAWNSKYYACIEESLKNVGWYLYIYRLNDQEELRDELQDDFQTCKERALENFDIPLDSWKEVQPHYYNDEYLKLITKK